MEFMAKVTVLLKNKINVGYFQGKQDIKMLNGSWGSRINLG